MAFDWPDAEFPVRDDLKVAYRSAWERFAAPGTWWTGAERVGILAEARAAPECALCRERKQALSPHAIEGKHDSVSSLPPAAIDLVHRVVTDASRLSRSWYEKTLADGLSEEQYVEALAVVVQVISIDAFCHALDLTLEPLPEPLAGEPSRVRPPGAVRDDAWVSWLDPANLGPDEADVFKGAPRTANVLRALSLVPAEVRSWQELSAAQYLEPHEMMDLKHSKRAIDRAQIELVAGRVSALNECFY